MFVVTSDPTAADCGIGKLVDGEESPGVIQYFVSAADPPVERRVAPDSIREVELNRQERVFFRDATGWRVGRFEGYVGPEELGIMLPNRERAQVHVKDAFVRSNLHLGSPLSLLKARNTETPFWHEGRTALVRAFSEQRCVYRGLAALASSNIDVFLHQLTIVERILNDPVPRYLLADEVGLGKTIEAGIVIRQHLLDEPDTASVLVAAPDNLVPQWTAELNDRFQLEFDDQVQVFGHSDLERRFSGRERATFLVIDEAHEVARHAYEQESAGRIYRVASELAQRATGVLLLSATPVLHNEEAFLAMLHLLDPAAHCLEDIEGFRHRVVHREDIATAVRDLEDDANEFLIEPALEQLRPLCDSSKELAAHVEEVTRLIDEDPDDSSRVSAISTLRTHLHECYRLDSRLLRTRRAQTSVRDELPRRKHVRWALEDHVRSEVFEWLDQWRFNAADSEDADAGAQAFLWFLEAALAHPTVLKEAIARRRSALLDGANEYFEGETEFLGRPPKVFDVASDPRIDALAELVRKAKRPTKWVVFVSESTVADGVTRTLGNYVEVVRLTTGSGAKESLKSFRENTRDTVLVCDRESELGLNLQEFGANLVHFDLPLNTNRIEQRIGRLDRLAGSRNEVLSYVPFVVTQGRHSNYEAVWASCLMDAVKVFDRSVASLQHALDAGRARLAESILDGGVDAVNELSASWNASGGPLSLDAELRRVQNQDLLDQLENVQTEHFDTIEDYEYSTEPSLAERFVENICAWAVRRLNFRRHSRNEDDTVVEFETSNHTLLATHHLARLFFGSLRFTRRRRGLSTGPLAFDRDRAKKSALPIARIGHPFIEDLERLTEWDDRGRAYAFWRKVDSYESRFSPGNPEELFFRFDFLITADLARLVECARAEEFSIGAVKRRAEEFLPPLFETIWVNTSGEHVTSEELLQELEQPYSKADVNLRVPRWEAVDDWGLVANWSRVCDQVEASARSHVHTAIDLDALVTDALRQVSERHREVVRRLEARMSIIENRAGEESVLDIERRLHECLCRAIENPHVRLDSVGAVFVSERSPFEVYRDGLS